MSMAPSDPSNPDPGKPEMAPPPGVADIQQTLLEDAMRKKGMDPTPQLTPKAIEEFDAKTRDFEENFETEIPLGHVPDSFVKRNKAGELEIHQTNWIERRWMSWAQGINLMTHYRDTPGTWGNYVFGSDGVLKAAEDPDENPLGAVGANMGSVQYAIPASLGKLTINTINALGTFAGIDMDAMTQAGVGPVDSRDVYGQRHGAGGFVEGMSQWLGAATVGVSALPASTGTLIGLAGASVVADTIAFDPEHDGNAVTALRDMNEQYDWWDDDTDAWLEEFDARHIAERDGRMAGYGMMAAEGAFIGLGADSLFGMFGGALRGKRWFDSVMPDLQRAAADEIDARRAEVLELGLDEPAGKGSEIPGLVADLEASDAAASRNQADAHKSWEAASSTLERTHNARRAQIIARVSAKMEELIVERTGRAKQLHKEGYTQSEITSQLRIEGLEIGRVSEDVLIPGFGNLLSDAFGTTRTEGEVIARTLIFGKGADNSTMFTGMDPNKIFVFEGATPQGRALWQQESRASAKEFIGTVAREERLQGRGTLGKQNTAKLNEVAELMGLSKGDLKAIKGLMSDELKQYPMKKDGGQWAQLLLRNMGKTKEGAPTYPLSGIKRNKAGEITAVKFKWKPIASSYGRDKSGNALKFGTRAFDRRADMLAGKLVERMKKLEETAKGLGPEADAALKIMEQRTWYQGMTARYGNEFGSLMRILTDMKGATSAQTPVESNFDQAMQLIQQFSRGTYDETLSKYKAFRDAGGSHKEWADAGNPLILKLNGKKFGANTQPVMETMSDLWSIKLGKSKAAPKTPNFSGNLRGEVDEATIDLWADRGLQEDFDGSLIPPIASTGVRGKYQLPGEIGKHYGVSAKEVEANPELYPSMRFGEGRGHITTEEFGVGQEAFHRAAKELREFGGDMWRGVKALDLQAQSWFATKADWTRRNATTVAGEGGSFEAQAEMYAAQRYNVMGAKFWAVSRADIATRTMLAELSADDTVRAFTHSPTTTLLPGGVPGIGYQSGSLEITTSNVVGNRNIVDGKEIKKGVDRGVTNTPTGDSVRRAAAELGLSNYMDRVYIHEFVPGGEADFAANPNLRPGFEIKFDEIMDATQMKPFLDRLQEEGLSAETIHHVDANPGRANNTKITGIRSVYVPEDAGVEHLVGNPIEALKHMQETESRIEELMTEFLDYDGVKSGDQIYVDTEILRYGEYEQVLEEVPAGTPVPATSREKRTRQSWFDQPEAADGRAKGSPEDKDLPGDAGQTRLLAQTDEGSPRRVIKGFAEIDDRNSSAIIGGMMNPDVGTAIHEVGHALRNHLFSTGVLSEGSRARLTTQFGTDGVWDVAAEERFADALMGMAANSDFSKVSDEMGIIAAKMRDLYRHNKGSEWVDGMSDDTRAIMEVLQTKPLPIEYEPGKWMPAMQWSTLIAKIRSSEQRAAAAGSDAPEVAWMDHIEPGDWPGVSRMGREGSMNFRFDLDTDEQIVKYLAYFNDLSRELYANGIIPKQSDAVRDAAAGKLMNKLVAGGADLTGDRVGDMLRAKTLASSPEEISQVHSAVMMANMAQLKWIKRLADKAGNTNDPVDYAKLQRAFLQYQQIQVHASRLRSMAGQTLQAYKSPVALPTQKQLDDQVVSGKFLENLGMNAKSGRELVTYIQALQRNGDTAMMTSLIEETNRSGWEIARRAFFEVYMNALLSAPATWAAISSVSPAFVMAVDGVGKIAGAGINWFISSATGNRGAAARQLDMIEETFRNVGRNFANMRAVFKNMGKVILEEQNQFMQRGFRDDPQADMRTIQRNMFGTDNWLAKGVQGFILDATGRTVRAPSAAIMTIDEGFRTMNGITAMQMKLWDDQWSKILSAEETFQGRVLAPSERRSLKKKHARQINEYVSEETQKRVRDGQLMTRQRVAEDALDNPEIMAMTDPLDKGQAIQKYVQENWKLEHQETAKMVGEEATSAVFQKELGPAGQHLQGLIDNKWLGGVPRIIMPFVRTPLNIQKKFVGALPTTLAVELYHRTFNWMQPKDLFRGRAFKGEFKVPKEIGIIHAEMMAKLNSGDPRQIAQARGQQAIGIAFFAGAYAFMSNEGGITLTGGGGTMTAGDKERKVNWQPYSIHIPGQGWISYKRMDPWGQILALVADTAELYQAEDGQGSMEEKVKLQTALIATIGAQLQEKSYLQGLSKFMDAFTGDPDDAEPYFAGLAQTLDPTNGQFYFSSMGRHVQHARDGYFREMRDLVDARRANSWIYNPDDAPPLRNVIGEKIPRQGWEQSESGVVRFLNYTNPMIWRGESDDPVNRELSKHDMPMNRPSPQKGKIHLNLITNDTYKYTAYDRWGDLTESIRLDYQTTADVALDAMRGEEEVEMHQWTLREALHDLVTSKKYAVLEGLDDPKSGNPLQGLEMMAIINRYTDRAYKEMLKEFPEAQVMDAHFQREHAHGRADNVSEVYKEDVAGIEDTMGIAKDAADDVYDRKINAAGVSSEDAAGTVERLLDK